MGHRATHRGHGRLSTRRQPEQRTGRTQRRGACRASPTNGASRRVYTPMHIPRTPRARRTETGSQAEPRAYGMSRRGPHIPKPTTHTPSETTTFAYTGGNISRRLTLTEGQLNLARRPRTGVPVPMARMASMFSFMLYELCIGWFYHFSLII